MILTTGGHQEKKSVVDFDAFYEKYQYTFWKKIYFKIHDEHHSEEIATDVFMKLYNNIHIFKDEESAIKWMHVTTDRTIVDFCRKNKRYKEKILIRPDDDAAFTTAEDSMFESPMDNLLKQETAEEVNKIMRTLKQKYFEVIDLHYYKGLSAIEIADMLHISKFTVYSRLDGAADAIKKELKRYNRKGGKKNV